MEGSELHWLHPFDTNDEAVKMLYDDDEDPKELLSKVTLIPIVGDISSRKHLQVLPLEKFDSIVVLGNASEGDVESMDSQSMACVLLIRDILRVRREAMGVKKEKRTHIISNILDPRSKALMEVAHISDFMLSNQHMSRVLAMVAEERGINGIKTQLLTSAGSELYVRPAATYVAEGDKASFFDIMARARNRKEVALGFIERIDHTDHDKHAAGRAFINPAEKAERRQWGSAVCIIVLAED